MLVTIHVSKSLLVTDFSPRASTSRKVLAYLYLSRLLLNCHHKFVINIRLSPTSVLVFLTKNNFRSKFCYKLTTHITDEQACLIEPMGVAHNVLERIGVDGKDLVVIGCGPGKL